MPTENNAIVLDYLRDGKTTSSKPTYRREKNLAQVLGLDYFTLLEVVIREGMTVAQQDVVYIGSDVREKVHHIVGRIDFGELTSTARVEAEYTLDKLIGQQEARFVKFFNECSSLTPRLHRLELLPGIGKKHMWEILKVRQIKPFENYEDIAQRVKLLPNPRKLIKKRIIDELKGVDEHGKQIKYKLFVGVPFFPPLKPSLAQASKGGAEKGGSGEKKSGALEAGAPKEDASQKPEETPEQA